VAESVCGTMQSSEVVGVIVLERCLVQLDDDTDQSLYSFIVGEFLNFGFIHLRLNCRHQELLSALRECGFIWLSSKGKGRYLL